MVRIEALAAGLSAVPSEGDMKMARTAEKTADTVSNVEFPTFDTARANDQLRSFAEKGVEQSKEAYARIKAGAETAQKAFESTYETARTAGSELSLKSIAAMRSNADATFTHLEQLFGVKSLSELVELQASFLRGRFETGLEQSKDFQAAASKAMEEMTRPIKDVVEKSVSEFKAA